MPYVVQKANHLRHISSYKSEIDKYFGNQLKWINQF